MSKHTKEPWVRDTTSGLNCDVRAKVAEQNARIEALEKALSNGLDIMLSLTEGR